MRPALCNGWCRLARNKVCPHYPTRQHPRRPMPLVHEPSCPPYRTRPTILLLHHLSRHLSKLLCAYQMLGHMPTWGGLCTQGHLSYCFSRFGGRGILHHLGKGALAEPHRQSAVPCFRAISREVTTSPERKLRPHLQMSYRHCATQRGECVRGGMPKILGTVLQTSPGALLE